jgi:hypothetical protein
MRSDKVETDALSPMEEAADVCSKAFDRLGEDDQRALHVRLLATGAINAGSLAFVDQVAEEARQAVIAFVRERGPADRAKVTH